MLKLDEKLLAANRETEIFSASIAADRIEGSLEENAKAIEELAGFVHGLYTSAMANLLTLLARYLARRGEGGPARELGETYY
jgi:hypothetical protein